MGPNFLVVGETKCGTTSLYEDLAKHPQVLPPNTQNGLADYKGGIVTLQQKEIRFFDRYWGKGTDWYFSQFPHTTLDQITGEASPTYLYRDLAMERIRHILPGVKLIIMLRNPTDRLYSHFYHLAKITPEWKNKYPTFEAFINSAYESDYYLIDKGIYINSLKRCCKIFDQSQIHIVKSEDMFLRPKETYNNILNFLEIHDFSLSSFSHFRKNNYPNPIDKTTKQDLDRFYRPYNQELANFLNTKIWW